MFTAQRNTSEAPYSMADPHLLQRELADLDARKARGELPPADEERRELLRDALGLPVEGNGSEFGYLLDPESGYYWHPVARHWYEPSTGMYFDEQGRPLEVVPFPSEWSGDGRPEPAQGNGDGAGGGEPEAADGPSDLEVELDFHVEAGDEAPPAVPVHHFAPRHGGGGSRFAVNQLSRPPASTEAEPAVALDPGPTATAAPEKPAPSAAPASSPAAPGTVAENSVRDVAAEPARYVTPGPARDVAAEPARDFAVDSGRDLAPESDPAAAGEPTLDPAPETIDDFEPLDGPPPLPGAAEHPEADALRVDEIPALPGPAPDFDRYAPAPLDDPEPGEFEGAGSAWSAVLAGARREGAPERATPPRPPPPQLAPVAPPPGVPPALAPVGSAPGPATPVGPIAGGPGDRSLPAMPADDGPDGAASRTTFVAGERSVVLHTREGQALRGSLRDAELAAPTLALETRGGTVRIPVARVRAVFFVVPVGAPLPAPRGRMARVVFEDGRPVNGLVTGFHPEAPGFFLMPVDPRGRTERIFIYREGIRSITFV